MTDYYYLIHPAGDRKVISVLEISEAMHYELGDYLRASKKMFTDENEDSEYGKVLAKQHGLLFRDKHGQSPYLDDDLSP